MLLDDSPVHAFSSPKEIKDHIAHLTSELEAAHDELSRLLIQAGIDRATAWLSPPRSPLATPQAQTR